MIQDLHKKFETYLKDNDGRYTVQKQAIASLVFKKKEPFEVEEFIDTIRRKDKTFSRATVYRTIKQLSEAGLLQKIPNKDGKLHYEAVKENQHYAHLICNRCGKIFSALDESLESQIISYCKTVSFYPEYQSIHIYGCCKSCH